MTNKKLTISLVALSTMVGTNIVANEISLDPS